MGLKTKMLGGGLAGLAAAAVKQQLGAAANGVVNVELWEPVKTMQFPGVMDFLKKYQGSARRPKGSIRSAISCRPSPMPNCRSWARRSRRPRRLNDDKLAEYMHSHSFSTIVGDIAFGPDGEWTEARPIWVQYHDIKGSDIEQFREPKTGLDPLPAAIQDRRLDLALCQGAGIAWRRGRDQAEADKAEQEGRGRREVQVIDGRKRGRVEIGEQPDPCRDGKKA